ncbi:hypothetical protein EVAR_82197_1 [Eumeta japonica]|uniref:Uncharacterized protein n=1 Tax=Eumeta variegata TaxID=151549 RepID=A0A4C1W6N4_EUMVA|nr:hypothetical protein EVAR_82197_1 [Eumeta japonica]
MTPQRQSYSSQYRHSIADDVKSRNESIASTTENAKDRYGPQQQRIYTSPIHVRKVSKNEMFEISPYAEFALGFRTFDHVENQDLPSRLPNRPRFDTETSFQARSESDDSDSASKTTIPASQRSCVKRLTLSWRGYENTVALNIQRSRGGGIERDRVRVNAWHSNACA